MAYGLKYYWTGWRTHEGSQIPDRLEIRQRDYTGIARQIGDLVSLSIGYNGDNDYYTPIVKSILDITLVDSSDKAQTPEVADSYKYGGWEEFFTPDSTLYEVRLLEHIPGGNVVRWTGYVTPDSWEEDLIYRGQINITCRDNIGHLSDFDFDAWTDARGLITLRYLILRAGNKIGQSFTWDEPTSLLKAWYQDTNGQWQYMNLPDVVLDASLFTGKTWYEVLEGVLDSFGLCLRWQDYPNKFIIAAIYRLDHADYLAANDSHEQHDTIFANNSGHRTLTPACRAITDSVTFEPHDEYTDTPSGYTMNNIGSGNYVYRAYTILGEHWQTARSAGGYITTLDPGATEDVISGQKGWQTPDTLMVRLAESQSSEYFYRYFALPSGIGANLSFGVNKGEFITGSVRFHQFYVSFMGNSFTVSMMLHWVPYADGQAHLYWDGASWITSETRIEFSVTGTAQGYADIESKSFNMVTPGIPGSLELRFYCGVGSNPSVPPRYMRISQLRVEISDTGSIESDKVTTVYDEKQNVLITRNPMLAQYPGLTTVGGIINTIYSNAYALGCPNITGWSFPTSAVPQFGNLAVFVHRQMLCLHGAALSVFTGELIAPNGNPHFSDIWKIGERKCYLVGGQLDLLTGRIQNGVLQEYLNYEDVWNN